MSLSFFPKVVKFFELFEKQNQMLMQATETLNALFKEFKDVSEKCKKINDIENQADELNREISNQLSLTFITPIDREDIFQINTSTEEVINSIRAVSTRLGLYNFIELRKASVELVNYLHLIINETSGMLKNLRAKKDVVESVNKIKSYWNHSEMLLLLALGEIYESEPQNYTQTLDVIKWTQIYDRIENAIQKAVFLANILEGVSLKNA